jgi:hypothetical protein
VEGEGGLAGVEGEEGGERGGGEEDEDEVDDDRCRLLVVAPPPFADDRVEERDIRINGTREMLVQFSDWHGLRLAQASD